MEIMDVFSVLRGCEAGVSAELGLDPDPRRAGDGAEHRQVGGWRPRFSSAFGPLIYMFAYTF